jgi:hypothetical protein
VLLVWTGDFAVPEFIYVAYGTTEVVPFPNSDAQSFFATTEVVPFPDRGGKRHPFDIKKASSLS